MKKITPFLLFLAVLSIFSACTKKDDVQIKTQKELITAHVWVGDSITPNVTTSFPLVTPEITAALAAASTPRSNKATALEFKTTNDAVVYARDSTSGVLSNPQTTPYTIDETTKKVTFTNVDAFIPAELAVLLTTYKISVPKVWDIQTLDDTRLRLYAEQTQNVTLTIPNFPIPVTVPITLKIKLSFKK